MRILSIICCVLIISVNSHATESVIMNGIDDPVHSSITQYNMIMGSGSLNVCNWNSDESDFESLIPMSGTFSDLRVELSSSPGSGGDNYVFTIRKDTGSGLAATDVSCTITDSETTCDSAANTASFAAGDTITFESNPGGSPSSPDAHWTVKFDSDTTSYTMFTGGGHGNLLATSGTEYWGVGGCNNADTDPKDVNVLFPTTGTLRDLYVELLTAPGAGTSRTFAMGSVDCTISNTETKCNSASDTQAISAGDSHAITATVSGTPAASEVKYGVVFVTDTEGEFVISQVSDNTTSTTATEYHPISSSDGVWTGTVTNADTAGQECTFKKMYVESDGSPGTGNSWDFTLFQNGSATSLTCQISEGGETCNFSADVTINDFDLLSTQVVPTSSPTSRSIAVGYLGFIDPGGATPEKHQQIIISKDNAFDLYKQYNCKADLTSPDSTCFSCCDMPDDLNDIFNFWNMEWEDSKISWDEPLNRYAFFGE